MRTVGGGAVALTLAVGAVAFVGPAVGAAEPDAPPGLAVAVSGTSTLVGEEAPGEARVDDGVVRQRGAVLITNEDSSDPRVSGRGTIVLNVDAFSDGEGNLGTSQIRYGTMRIENDDGSWEGSFAGRFSNGRFIQTYWLRGKGAYDGLTYVVTAGGDGPVWISEGLIYPGSPPP